QPGSEHVVESVDFHLVARAASGGARDHATDLRRLNTRRSKRLFNGRGRSLGANLVGLYIVRVMRGSKSADLEKRLRATRSRTVGRLEHPQRRTFTEHRAIAIRRKRARAAA